MAFVTYQDVIDQLVDYLGGSPSDVVLRDCRRAIQEAYRDFAHAHRWSYLLAHGRVVTTTPYSTGTIGYEVGSRRVYLSDGTWPEWAAGAYLRVGSQAWKVAERLDDATVVLDELVNPGGAVDFALRPLFGATREAPIVVSAPAHGRSDGDRVVVAEVGGVAAANGTWTITVVDANSFSLDGSDGTLDDPYEVGTGTWRSVPTQTFTLYRDGYLLPADFIASDQALYEQNWGGMEYVHPRAWMFEERYVFAEGNPQCCTVMGDRTYPGRLLLRLAPFPSESRSVDFLYHRRPRPLVLAAEAAGRVAIDAGGVVLTGTGTSFTSAMVGSVARLSASATRPPSAAVGGFSGLNPPVLEALVAAVDSATSLRLAEPCPQDLAGVMYTIGDAVDLEPGAMMNAFYRCCEHHVSLNRTLKDKPSARQAYLAALGEARAADSRSFAGRVAGEHGPYRPRLRDMPIDLFATG